jgi:carbamoyltransferase
VSFLIGISAYYHDSAVCIVQNGDILFAAQEERYSRIKNDKAFPSSALQRGLSFCNLSLSDAEAVVFYEKPFIKFERLVETYLRHAPRGIRSFVEAMQEWSSRKLFIKSEIRKALREVDDTIDVKKIQLLFSQHHLSHAASAFYPSPFMDAAILTIDGVGEYATTGLYRGQGNTISNIKEIHFPHSIGLLYSAATYYLGFKVNSDEYKVMGLAAYGNRASEEYQRFLTLIEDKLLTILQDGSYALNMPYFTYPYTLRMVDDKKWKTLFGLEKRESKDSLTPSHCNFAAAFQSITETAVLSLCREIKRETQSENLCLAGGVALNGVVNGIIERSRLFKNIFIQPAAGDAGGALGAALAAYYLHFGKERKIILPDGLRSSLLGCTSDEATIEWIAAQHPANYKCESEEELCLKIAQYIADGKVIGWYQGRMEFGPRALGNRSIIADARNPAMQKHLNLKIKNRESFRPFAPAILEEDVSEYFDFDGISPYMLQVHMVRKEHALPVPEHYADFLPEQKLYTVKSDIPAVTHVDFSVRIQTVSREEHALFWKLIHSFKTLTGCPLVINTSFNGNEEPIVCTPGDAYACFLKTGIDILVLHQYIIYKS